MKKALQTTMDFGAEGVIRCAGRLGGAELARVETTTRAARCTRCAPTSTMASPRP